MDIPRTLDIRDLAKYYPNRWLAVKVLTRDKRGGQPIEVEVLRDSTDIYSTRVGLDKNEEYCILYTGPIPEEGFVLMY